jgi:hypothetical protein
MSLKGTLKKAGKTTTEVANSPGGRALFGVYGNMAAGAGSMAQGNNPLKNTPFGAMAGVSSSAQEKDRRESEDFLKQITEGYDGITPPDLKELDLEGPAREADVKAALADPSAMNKIAVDPNARKAQLAQLSALQSLAANGGRDAATDADLAQIQSQENQNERGQREAILQNANSRGMGGSGNSLLASLVSSQGGIDRQSARDLGVSAQQAEKALAAGQGAAAIGSNVENQDFGEKAAIAKANDAVSQFNASNLNDVAKFNTSKNQGVNNAEADAHNQGQVFNNYQIPQAGFGNKMAVAQGKQAGAKAGLDYNSDLYKADTAANGNQLGSIIGGAATLMAAAHGGRVPGKANVAGDSPENDSELVAMSPDEVAVPRSLSLHGSEKEIGHFVKHAPTLKADPKKAQLAALLHLSRHGKVA